MYVHVQIPSQMLSVVPRADIHLRRYGHMLPAHAGREDVHMALALAPEGRPVVPRAHAEDLNVALCVRRHLPAERPGCEVVAPGRVCLPAVERGVRDGVALRVLHV